MAELASLLIVEEVLLIEEEEEEISSVSFDLVVNSIFEDLKFKRQVAFIDDDNILEITIKQFSHLTNQ